MQPAGTGRETRQSNVQRPRQGRLRVDDIIAIDNYPGMLAAAEEALRPALPDGTTLILSQSTGEDYALPPGRQADLVTICRAFHWPEKAAVLARLSSQVAPDGAVAIFGDNSMWNSGTT